MSAVVVEPVVELTSDRDFADFLRRARLSQVSWFERPWSRAAEQAQIRYEEDSDRLLEALRSGSRELLQAAVVGLDW